MAACFVTSFAPQARRLMFARRSPPDYPSSIFLVSFVFLSSLLFCLISTVLWSGATSICDGIILVIFMSTLFSLNSVLCSSRNHIKENLFRWKPSTMYHGMTYSCFNLTDVPTKCNVPNELFLNLEFKLNNCFLNDNILF